MSEIARLFYAVPMVAPMKFSLLVSKFGVRKIPAGLLYALLRSMSVLLIMEQTINNTTNLVLEFKSSFVSLGFYYLNSYCFVFTHWIFNVDCPFKLKAGVLNSHISVGQPYNIVIIPNTIEALQNEINSPFKRVIRIFLAINLLLQINTSELYSRFPNLVFFFKNSPLFD